MKAGIMRINLVLLILCMFAGIFVSSCGMEEVVSVEEPVVTYNNPLYSSADPLTWYFSFKTSTEEGASFIGTDIYYRIYNNSSTLESERSSILAVNSSTNSSSAATRMIDTYKYKQLGTSTSVQNSVFFPKSDNGKSVVLRLKTYASADGNSASSDVRYTSHACVGAKEADSGTFTYRAYIPYRNGNSKSFDFFDDDGDNKNGTRDVEPKDGDEDYKHSSTSSSANTYYVQLFAVGVALDQATVSSSYSLVLDLGSVPIKKGE